MPFIIRPLNRVIMASLAALAFFVVLVVSVRMENLIIALNGIFAGTMAAIAVAYWRLLWNAVLGIRPYDRVRQMTLGFALCWFAYLLGVAISICFRTAGYDVNTSLLTAASRYVAIIAAILQVTAPDFGLGLFHGRERKTMWTGIIFGLVVALFMILSQSNEVLSSEEGALPGEAAAPGTIGADMQPTFAARLDLPTGGLRLDP